MEFDKLPTTIQDWLESTQVPEGLKEIGERHKISSQEIYEIQRLIVLLVLGKITPPEFQQNIKNEIQASNHEVLIKEIENKVFAPVRQELQELLSAYKKPEAEASLSAERIPPLSPAFITRPEKDGEPSIKIESRTETLSPSFQEKQPPSPPKTVHYSDLRTPLEPAFTEKTSVPTIRSLSPAAPSTSLPDKPTPSSPDQEPGPLNVVDLKDIPR